MRSNASQVLPRIASGLRNPLRPTTVRDTRGYALRTASQSPKYHDSNSSIARRFEQLRQPIAELEARLAKDSHNSSKPPSSNPRFRKPPPRSQRKVSGRKPSGQQGHKGATRPLVDNPDHSVVIPLKDTCICGRCRSQIPVQITPERRQVVERVIRSEVTEYRTVAGTCGCGR